MMSPSPITPNPHMGQTGPQTTPMNVPGPPGTPSAPQNPAIGIENHNYYDFNCNIDSPYPNQAKSPANSLVNGPIHSPSPSQVELIMYETDIDRYYLGWNTIDPPVSPRNASFDTTRDASISSPYQPNDSGFRPAAGSTYTRRSDDS